MGGMLLVMLATSFNLACATAMTSGEELDSKNELHENYRIDLTKRRYCLDKCSETHPIFSYDDLKIVLVDVPWDGKGSHHSVISRESGIIETDLRIMDIRMKFKGSCEATPFTGFPEQKF